MVHPVDQYGHSPIRIPFYRERNASIWHGILAFLVFSCIIHCRPIYHHIQNLRETDLAERTKDEILAQAMSLFMGNTRGYQSTYKNIENQINELINPEIGQNMEGHEMFCQLLSRLTNGNSTIISILSEDDIPGEIKQNFE